jgi:exonuclease III
MAARIHRPLKIVAFNANGIWKQRYKLSKQLQDLHIDVTLLSETHLKPYEKFCTPNYHFYCTDRFPGRKGGTAVAVRKGIPHNHVDLPPLVSIEATGLAYRLVIVKCYFQKSTGHTWNDAYITELLSFRHKSQLAGDLNAKHPF